ncbi:hypothetical protein ASPSYDRAFT_37735 [Aspergillus sydowii CBS 593.65]|uniref:Uncharacterized protein n=1 Tax=Aspergillus sydowii CBS 593.65 TaxID=1036612 RepID=A0A1L9SXY4_9EURO|nr:uncharacterized protein ASPSYDRAFT_37735 [Aspergillus sydowii CBS 593.65]OJJ51893.1 hypothetical protein ASPSYDRAFT_37735 [Aspergillus sydowii CBS 593.65]
MPRALIQSSKVDEHGIIHLARNHPWVNPWNPAIATCIRSNHDISWIPTVSKSLSLIYYITNYATKDDISPLQIVTKAALLRQAIESANNTPSPTRADLRLRQKGLDNFALRCFNSLSHDREVSGVHVASTLLGLPSYYTLHHNFIRINLWSLRQHIRSLTHLHRPSETSSAALTEETVTLEDATLDDIPFEEKHPRHSTHMQRLARSPSQTLTVTLQGQLTEFQTVEDSIPGGHPTTTAIENDLAEILLGLFIPWEKLATFVLSDSPPTRSIHHELAGPPYPVSDSDEETRQLAPTADEALDTETLLAAFFAISRRWALETLDAQRHLPTIASSSLPPESLQPLGVLPLDISHGSLDTASGLKFMPPTTIQEW